jgi:hypothetical protein
MIALYGSVDLARHGLAVVTVDNQPANALSHVRKGLKDDRERHRGTNLERHLQYLSTPRLRHQNATFGPPSTP